MQIKRSVPGVILAIAALSPAACTPTAIVSPSPASSVHTPAPPATAAPPAAFDCNDLLPTLLDCVAVVDLAASALSADAPRDRISSVNVVDGRTYRWCAPPYCVDAPAQSVWVQFNWDGDQWERIPLYIDPFDPESGWQTGFPFSLLPSSPPVVSPGVAPS